MNRICIISTLIFFCLPLFVAAQVEGGARWSVAFANVNSGHDEGNPVVWNRGLAFVSNRGKTVVTKYADRTSNDRFWKMWYVYDTLVVKSEPGPVWKKNGLIRPAAVRQSPNDSRIPAAVRPPAAMPDNVTLLKGDKVSGFHTKWKDRFHEGPFCFNSRQDTMYLTRNFSPEGKQAGRLRIDALIYRYGDWISVNSFPFNNPGWSCAHPALHPDGNMLVFVSDMPGGVGGKDLYYCLKSDTGWTAPRNAGPQLNSTGNEAFPSFGADGVLYFSSDRPGGIGRLDLYSTRLQANGESAFLTILPDPLNSEADDFGIWMAPGGRSGYMTSNRYGTDDILVISATL